MALSQSARSELLDAIRAGGEIITASDQFGGFAPESGWRRAKPPQFITQRHGLDPFRARMHGTYDLE
jgi:hypothetical protein